MRKKYFFYAVLAAIVFWLLFPVFQLHAPIKARILHGKISIGMPLQEVLTILASHKGRYSYTIPDSQLDYNTKMVCIKLKLDYDTCLKSNKSQKKCTDTFDKYLTTCQGKIVKKDVFLSQMSNISEHEKTNFFLASIDVLFMGPGFTHNTFDIFFDADNKVTHITTVQSWD